MKLNLAKIVSIGGTALSLAAMLIKEYADDKEMKETIAKEVAKAVAEKSK